MSKRLSLSALLGKAVSAALQLVWVGQEQQLVVDFGTTCAAFKLEIVAEEASSEIADDPNKWTDLFTTGAFAKRSRQVLTGLDTKSSDFDECIRKLLIVMEMTEEAGHQEGDSKPRRGLLSKKASRDMEAAKKLLEAIEQLTTSKTTSDETFFFYA
ncbi:hypothetical protein JG688_00004089 [Phytophthora aleatoria]|uniref:Uncharacterized protein n=1 Tax=Phytophthora aleatoria TaxID=2496075 RepID=A0A8J5ITJ5_9STRA|nr:hypothetical protein JG688_00004089 [Phytophthora aleatoria]